jgi:hypothetical protein
MRHGRARFKQFDSMAEEMKQDMERCGAMLPEPNAFKTGALFMDSPLRSVGLVRDGLR